MVATLDVRVLNRSGADHLKPVKPKSSQRAPTTYKNWALPSCLWVQYSMGVLLRLLGMAIVASSAEAGHVTHGVVSDYGRDRVAYSN